MAAVSCRVSVQTACHSIERDIRSEFVTSAHAGGAGLPVRRSAVALASCNRSPRRRSSTHTMADKVALVIGAGDGTGGAIAKRFAREGFVACVVRRTADKLAPLVAEIEADGGRARAFGRDARKEEQMVALVEEVERLVGPIEVAAFNVGANVPSSILEETARKYFRRSGRWPASAASSSGREAARAMVARGRGTILFTGATAAVRGRRGLRGLRRREARAPGARAEHGARARAEGHPRGARDDRRRRSTPSSSRTIVPSGLRAEGRRAGSSIPRTSRDHVLEAARPAPRRLDVRARPASLDGKLVTRPWRRPSSFLFDFGSPNAYLEPPRDPRHRSADRRALRLRPRAARRALQGDQQPVAGGGVRAASRTSCAYEMLETRRFVARHRLDAFTLQPALPGEHAPAHARRGGGGRGWRASCPTSRRSSATCGREPKKMDDPEVVARGADRVRARRGRGCSRGRRTSDVKEHARSPTRSEPSRAARSASPTFFVGDEMYFGKDRLRDVEEEIAGTS